MSRKLFDEIPIFSLLNCPPEFSRRAGRIIYYILAINLRERKNKTVQMDKQWILVTFLILVFIVSTGAGLPGKSPEVESSETGQVCIKDSCFSVEIAATQFQRQYGLMDREYLDPDRGMLFVFEKEGNHYFWMKNTLIPLDIIWINSSQDIVYIERNAQPCTPDFCPSIDPGKNASYVLEINGGLSDKYGINVGDKVNISYVTSSNVTSSNVASSNVTLLNSRDNFLTRKRAVVYHSFWKFKWAF
ncbi:hypothetical protein FXV91_17150 [Methanosarcina sp. DH2]|uniref:DUF192 domain-containing protein n=1 Tax=Methanosarcina sp. DH2 TaxID=2605639 RepID=UPI001E485777|nr:DUF192 domain-containing protein [Methanosarcina sp. DH2]MCC4771829.1 hypothetical protein [Methanosarcina sp. DH2]